MADQVSPQMLQALVSAADDGRLYNMLYGEVSGGSPQEINAVASVYLNRIVKEGLEKALKGSAAYNKKSKQYKIAESGNLNPVEKKSYDQIVQTVQELIKNPKKIAPYYYMENVKAFGNPSWSKGLPYEDIGRQRFYQKQ